METVNVFSVVLYASSMGVAEQEFRARGLAITWDSLRDRSKWPYFETKD